MVNATASRTGRLGRAWESLTNLSCISIKTNGSKLRAFKCSGKRPRLLRYSHQAFSVFHIRDVDKKQRKSQKRIQECFVSTLQLLKGEMGLFPCLQGNPAILSQSVIAAFRWKWKGYCSLPSNWLLAVKACMPSEYVTERGCVCVQSSASRHAEAERCKLSNSGLCLCSNTEREQLLDGRRGGDLA